MSHDDFDASYWEKRFGDEADYLENLYSGYWYDNNGNRYSIKDREEYMGEMSWEEAAEIEMTEAFHQQEIDKVYERDWHPPEGFITTRMKEILQWLSQSSLILRFQGNRGFSVPNINVRRKNGTVVNFIKWLVEEGFVDGRRVGEYRIKAEKSILNSYEKLFFIYDKVAK